ncbi:MAG: hypothetical protein ACP6KW_01465 [Candidatus Thorarchaeota archaeon]
MVDVTVKKGQDTLTQIEPGEESTAPITVELELVEVSDSSHRVKQIVVASVLAALSIAIAPSALMIQRVAGWGIALFDPVSLFWIAAFLIGGFKVGFVSMLAGTMGLFAYDPTGIGPVFKFLATLPMMAVPWYGARKLRSEVGGEALSRPKFFFTLMALAFLVRLGLMLVANFIYWGFILPSLGPAEIVYIVTVVLSINTVQSVGDSLVPFLVVYPTGLFKHFRMW